MIPQSMINDSIFDIQGFCEIQKIIIQQVQIERPRVSIIKMSNQQSIGMMEGAFFVPKTDLLTWVNTSLQLNITKVEQLGTGAAYCQILDMMFPGKVNMSKVNWKAKNQWEFINNLKILQQGFAKSKIQKYIDIQRLSKSKYQDNLEFIQWLKRYYDLFNKNSQTKNYDPVAVRKNAEVDFSFIQIRNHALKRDRQQPKERIKSKSPYDKIKPRINNRSVTLQKYQIDETNFYKGKLAQIKQILLKNSKQGDKLQKITEVLQEIKQQKPRTKTFANQEDVVQTLKAIPSKQIVKQLKQVKKIPKKDTKKPKASIPKVES